MKKYIAVFCGSRTGNKPEYTKAAKELAHHLVKNQFGLVYGGGKVGLMGVIADEVLSQGGDVIGVIPQKLYDKEVAHTGVTELITVETMHERKAIMADKAEAFIALPGGIGTLEELFEVFTWTHIGYHQKPCALYNAHSFYDQLNDFLDQIVNQDFLSKDFRNLLISESNAEILITKLLEKI